MTPAITSAAPRPLQGSELFLAGIVLAMANFVAVLDMTIVNVSVTHIAGSLAIAPTEGTYAITSYAVAEAIMVPLTGWLAARFGALRVFVTSLFLFGFFSAFCGLAHSLPMLVVGRILQGFAGGPLMPLSQTILMLVYPINKRATALGLWSITTMIAPILGPYLGGFICDRWSWPYIFLINIPIAIFCAIACWRLLKRFQTAPVKKKIDFGGLAFLIVWVSALQIMIDEGKNHDWFESTFIVTLGITALIGFIIWIIWEMTEKEPIVDLRVFGNRGYTISILTLCLAFGSVYGSNVLIPLWLQNYMGYTATTSGYVAACSGLLSIFAAPFAAKLAVKKDARFLVFGGVTWLGIMTFVLSFSATNMTFAQIVMPLFIQGLGLPFFFIPLTNLAISSVDPKEIASASGLLSFSRTLSGAISISFVTTAWENKTTLMHANLAELVSSSTYRHIPPALINSIVQVQSVMLATNLMFMIIAATCIFAASAIWLAPKPKHITDTSSVH